MEIVAADLRRLAPHARPSLVAGIVGAAGLLPRYDISTPLRLCHLMAQLAHESGGFRTLEEYTAGEAYEGRVDLGNLQPGDGARYKGRGLIQLTGRDNYRSMGALLHQPLEETPELAAEWPQALEIALIYWRRRRLSVLADSDDIEAITRKINGGLTGIRDRRRYLVVAKQIWAPWEAPPGPRRMLRRGDRGDDVERLQRMLNRHPATRPPAGLLEDGIFGSVTEAVVIGWQRSLAHLVADGIVGPHTWASLDAPIEDGGHG